MPSAPEPSPGPGQNDLRWFAEEVHPHDACLRSYLRSSLPPSADVDDVVQESYIRIWKARAREPITSAKAFLFRIARNLALDRLRRQRSAPMLGMDNLDALPAPDDATSAVDSISRQEKEQLLAEALATLPPRGRELIILCKLDRLSHREAAEKLGISERTVGEHLLRSTRRLGAELRRRGLHGLYEP